MNSNEEIKAPLSKIFIISFLGFNSLFFFFLFKFPPLQTLSWASKSFHSYTVQNSRVSNSENSTDTEKSPIEQVALTVPTTDDPSLPCFTFRTWILGSLACVVLSFLNQFFWYRKEPLSLTSISAQIAVVPLGHLMASTITERVFFKGRKLEFTLNPGPFNVKEHVLITIFANSGAGNVFSIYLVNAVKLFYKKELNFMVALVVVITSQVMGFGWAGLFRRYLVDPAAMWWPQNLVQVSLFRYFIYIYIYIFIVVTIFIYLFFWFTLI